ncbi:MAG: segregation/condensation protein A [Deltaproteobacteria bacterium]|nr:segregation/condensation protein A [Deltaproteobacteria bacterium]
MSAADSPSTERSTLAGATSESLLFEPLAEGSAACSIRLPVFDGPLDLLLHLIREDELEITDLPIAQVARQYLEYLELMRELHLDVAAEYLVMAATLAWIKSRMLLPPADDEAEEDGLDPRAELVARLLEYQRFQEAAAELGQRPLLGREIWAPPGEAPPPLPEAEREIEVGLLPLLEAFRRAMRQTQAAGHAHEVVTEAVTVRERMVTVIDALEAAEVVEFEALLRGPDGRYASRAVLVATFLAILELARITALRIFQSLDDAGAPEGPIRLRRAGEGDLRERLAEAV